MDFQELEGIITRAIEMRSDSMGIDRTAWRLFNGYYEGCPGLTIDIYARTLLLSIPGNLTNDAESIQNFLLTLFPQIECVVLNIHDLHGVKRRGIITWGTEPADKIYENGIWYAVNLRMNQDSSLYLDTRSLRGWLAENASGWSVFNAFAYTGSLGVAALAGGATRVVQVDRNWKFLSLAQQSCTLNNLDASKMELQTMDFFSAVARYKSQQATPGSLFDCVIADPPIFSSTLKGTVNLVNEGVRIINKIRPLVRDGGRIIMINNVLFLSGKEFMDSLEQLCKDGYLSIEKLVSVPSDITGFPQTIVNAPPADPTPFNHPTKIVIFTVKRKKM